MDLPRAGPGCEPAGAPAGLSRSRPGRDCRAAVQPFGRSDHRDSGRAQIRGGLSADRSGASGRADSFHDRRCGAGRRTHDNRSAPADGRIRHPGNRSRWPRPGRAGRQPIVRSGPRGSGVPDLHVGNDRCAESRCRDASQCHPTAPVVTRRLAVGAGTGVVTMAFAGLRCVGVGDLGCSATRRSAGGGARIGGKLTGGPARSAGHPEGDGVVPNSFRGRHVVPGRSGLDDAGGGRRGLPG